MHDIKKKRNMTNVLIVLVEIVLAAAFPVLYLYFKNADQANFADAFYVMLGYICAGLVTFFIVCLIIRKPAKAGLITDIFLLVFLNYSILENVIQSVFSGLQYWHIVPILIVAILHISWLIWKFIPDEISEISMPVISIVLCILIVLNAIPAIPMIIARKQAEQKTEQMKATVVKVEDEMPNVYYLIFDEYSSYGFMKKHYNYDNSAFIERLKKKGFSISNNSHNDSVKTTTIVANLMNMEYLVDDSWTEYDKLQIRKNGKLFSLLAERGYNLYSLTDTYGLQMINQAQKRSSATTVSGESLSDILLKNSVLYPLFTKQDDEIKNQIESITQYIHEKKSNRFLIAHFNLPHQPFIYDRNGNLLNSSSTDWKDKHYYLDQFIYATKVMEELVDTILQNDPDSVIFLQSDHSARAPSDPEIYKIVFSMEDMSNFFNSIYYLGKPMEIEGLSGVNTERLVFSTLLNLELPQIEVPYSEINGFAEGGLPR